MATAIDIAIATAIAVGIAVATAVATATDSALAIAFGVPDSMLVRRSGVDTILQFGVPELIRCFGSAFPS